jgi:hypothetical protein
MPCLAYLREQLHQFHLLHCEFVVQRKHLIDVCGKRNRTGTVSYSHAARTARFVPRVVTLFHKSTTTHAGHWSREPETDEVSAQPAVC